MRRFLLVLVLFGFTAVAIGADGEAPTSPASEKSAAAGKGATKTKKPAKKTKKSAPQKKTKKAGTAK
jgi:hypothetical protein